MSCLIKIFSQNKKYTVSQNVGLKSNLDTRPTIRQIGPTTSGNSVALQQTTIPPNTQFIRTSPTFANSETSVTFINDDVNVSNSKIDKKKAPPIPKPPVIQEATQRTTIVTEIHENSYDAIDSTKNSERKIDNGKVISNGNTSRNSKISHTSDGTSEHSMKASHNSDNVSQISEQPSHHSDTSESQHSDSSSNAGSDSMVNGNKKISNLSSDTPKPSIKDTPQTPLNPPIQANERREGLLTDNVTSKQPIKEIHIDKFDKDEKSQKLIKKAITSNDFLNNMMEAERLEEVIGAMVSRTYEPNSFIIREGEMGLHFFVSVEGKFDVMKGNKTIDSFGAGVVFGELAILYKAKRFASIRVATQAKVWMLDRKMFQKIMMKTGRQEREENVKFLKSVDILKNLPDDIINKIADLLKREFYATGTTIIRQGDPGDKFYIIRGGSITLTKRDKTGQERIIRQLKRGESFGEQALIHQDKRLASAIANDPGSECLTLDRHAFNNYLGDFEAIRNIVIADPVLEESDTMQPIKTIINPKYEHIKFDDLKIIGTLGVGGFGRVELAQYKNGETFALKSYKKIDIVQLQQEDHAYNEKDIMASCNSPFIVKLFKTFRNKKYLYFLMEPCLGGDVFTLLQKMKHFDEKTSRFMTACVVQAFEYLHTSDMIYRDLKPENLMLDTKGYVKLVDFGFAKRIRPTHKTWTFSGTPEYVAPEIILHKGHDRAVDYWALGIFIHELLTGKPPFRGKDHMKTYNLILKGIPSPMSPKIPHKAQQLIGRLCKQVATERLGYQKNGIADIKKHAWFMGFDWDKLLSQTMPAPLIRPVKGPTDLSNFEEFPSVWDDPPEETSDWDKHF